MKCVLQACHFTEFFLNGLYRNVRFALSPSNMHVNIPRTNTRTHKRGGDLMDVCQVNNEELLHSAVC